MSRITLLLILAILPCLPAIGGDADWPMWRADAARTGSSANPLPDDLSLRWLRNLGYPDSAFIHQARMCADVSYAPVAADGLLFVPSNLRDEVAALDLATGKLKWRSITGGPVRFAPVYHSGKLYFGSDDGLLYCVQARTGKLLWKTRGTPDHLPHSKLLLNGRLSSRWPVRGAPVIHDEKVFFGAGIWPEEGVYVTALDAESGKRLWQTDALSLQVGGMNDHGALYDLGLPPQGYLAVIDGKLAVASGRSLAAFLNPYNGEVEPYNCYYVKTTSRAAPGGCAATTTTGSRVGTC
jgi:outer membrane protein assembly factor BamB